MVPPDPPPVSASTSVEIVMPIAVRMFTMVMPCSRKSANALSQHLVFVEEPPDGLTNSVNLPPESCSVRKDGFEPRLSLELDV